MIERHYHIYSGRRLEPDFRLGGASWMGKGYVSGESALASNLPRAATTWFR